MKVKCLVGKIEALMAGNDEYGERVIEVPAQNLSVLERRLLSYFATKYNNVDFDVTTFEPLSKHCSIPAKLLPEEIAKHLRCYPSEVCAAKPEDIKALLARAHCCLSEAEALISKFLQNLLTAPVESLIDLRSGRWRVVDTLSGEGLTDPLLDEKKAEIAAKIKILNDVREETDRAKEAADEAAKKLNEEREARFTQALRDWAMMNGSPLLIARIVDGYNWQGLARVEYVQSALGKIGAVAEIGPDGYSFEKSFFSKEPSLEAILAAREINKRLLKHNIDAFTGIVVQQYEPDEEESEAGRTVIFAIQIDFRLEEQSVDVAECSLSLKPIETSYSRNIEI